jgi:hypothetical protein
MAQTGRLTHRYGIFPICTIPVGLVATFWGTPHTKKQQLNPQVLCKSGKSDISVGQATDLSQTGGSAVPVGAAAANYKMENSLDQPKFCKRPKCC